MRLRVASRLLRSARLSLVLLCVLPVGALGAPLRAQTSTARSAHRPASAPARPLWPGARFTEAERQRALMRGLNFIYRTARDRANFAAYGGDYIWCFYTIATASADPSVRSAARRMGLERARAWRRAHRTPAPDAD